MNIEFIGIYWSSRYQSIEDCAIRMEQTVKFLQKIDQSFIYWYSTLKPKKNQLLEAVDCSYEGIIKLLDSSRQYDEVGNILDKLGYRIYLKSGLDFSRSHVLSISCNKTSEYLSNLVGLSLANPDQYNYLKQLKIARNIYDNLIDIWDGENGVLRGKDNVNYL
ncbi:Imm52 family immunity protein [[Flexibacter] sp. ATCC 35208]|uniref:Imm52 family immunity protein n=1 Tax=[Flexibacter] sp. ATCC 35208 TaxID=1936242 RepID=UPI0009CDB71D|nr:Imm52 family immunity protein [[Flexibacter] sp. ATCC 35208]OMP74543.1 hypothetical protein BW716_34795 [[Flexibacter] sp. ATCC 35208]